MKLVILGSGTSVPHAQRASPGFWLETEAGSVLLDVSAEVSHRMAQEKLDWADLHAIWVSHFHLDHVGGLTPFLFGMKWAPQTRARRRPLKIYGPTGLRNLFDAINESNNYGLLEQPFAVELIEVLPGHDFEVLAGLNVKTFSTPHTKESLAIRLTDKRGISLAYTSDTGWTEKLVDFARAANVLIVECSFRKNKPVQTHLELADAMKLAQASQAQKVILTHLYPEWDGLDIVAEAKALWPGQIIEAVDGLQLEF